MVSPEGYAGIIKTINHYSFCYDDGDFAGLGELFVEDAVFNIDPPIDEMDMLVGRERIVAALQARRTATGRAQRRHFVTNTVILSASDDVAESMSYLLLGSTSGAGLEILVSGAYRDRLVREGGTWRFAARSLRLDTEIA